MNDDYEEILISTPIDQMIQIIKEQGEVPLEYLALKLKYDPETIEDWARILERDGILEIKYGLDKTIIRWNAPTKEEFEKRATQIEEQKAFIESKAESIQERIKQEEKEIKRLIEMLEKEVEVLKQERDRISAFFETVEELKTDVYKTASQLEKEVLGLRDHLNQLTTELNAIEMIVKAVDPQELKQLIQEIMRNIEDKSTYLNSLIQELEEKKKELEKYALPEVSEIEEIKKEIREFKQRLPKLEAAYTALKSVGEVLKDKEEFIREYEELKQEVDKLIQEINLLSGPVDVLEKKIKDIAERMAELQKKGAELNQQLMVHMEVISNLEGVIDKESLEQLLRLAEKIEKWEEVIQRFPETVHEIGEVLTQLTYRLQEYREEHGKITTQIKGELQALERFLEIEEGFYKDSQRLIADIKNIKKEAGEGYLKIQEKLEAIEKLKETLDEILTSDSFMAGLKALENLEQRMGEVVEKFEMLKEIYTELEDLKKQYNILIQN
ncbi:MAG: hypothetical protein GXN92_00400, partial [Candidatus Micrarchaeota archaeon]|nr:hypothetical protein [Candidatus Micrarchaeota archaeon]